MLNKLIALYSCVISLHFMTITCHGAVLSLNMTSIAQHRTLTNMGYNSVTESEDKLDPIIQTHNWLAAPTILTSTMTLLTVPAPSRQNSDLRNNFEVNAKQKYHQLYTNLQTYHNSTYNVHHDSGNNSKRHINALTSQSQISTKSNSLSSLQSIKHNNLKSHVYPANNKNNKKTNNLNNANANLYSQMQMSEHIKSQVMEYQKPLFYSANEKNYSISAHSHPHSHRLTNVTIYKKAKNSSLSFTNWHYLPKSPHQAEDNIFVTPIKDTNSTTATRNLHVKISNNNATGKNDDIVKNSAHTILAKSLNSFKTNENLMENSKLYNFVRYGGIKSLQIYNTPPKSKSADEAALAASVLEENFTVEQFLRKMLKPVEDFYRNFGDIIISTIRTNDEDDDYDLDSKSNEDLSGDDNDLQLLNSSSHTLNVDTTTIAEATIAATLERMFPLDIENSLFSLAAIDKGKGGKGHVDKGDIKYSVIKLPSAAASSGLSLRKSYETQNKTVIAPFESSASKYAHKEKHLPILSGEPSSQKIHTSSYLLKAPTSKTSLALSSGRKMKKFKKKFKKILLPLLLAYKLKFMALIPLLIGGLVLLVGSTGLAGFFFALFTAVMSLKSDNRSAFIVKKY